MVTARALCRSVLLPIIVMVMSAVAFSLSSASHLATFSKDASLVMS